MCIMDAKIFKSAIIQVKGYMLRLKQSSTFIGIMYVRKNFKGYKHKIRLNKKYLCFKLPLREAAKKILD